METGKASTAILVLSRSHVTKSRRIRGCVLTIQASEVLIRSRIDVGVNNLDGFESRGPDIDADEA